MLNLPSQVRCAPGVMMPEEPSDSIRVLLWPVLLPVLKTVSVPAEAPTAVTSPPAPALPMTVPDIPGMKSMLMSDRFSQELLASGTSPASTGALIMM